MAIDISELAGQVAALQRPGRPTSVAVVVPLVEGRAEIVRESLFSPRLAATWMLTPDGKTKLSAGVGIFHDRTPLGFIVAPYDGQRFDTLYGPDGVTPLQHATNRGYDEIAAILRAAG